MVGPAWNLGVSVSHGWSHPYVFSWGNSSFLDFLLERFFDLDLYRLRRSSAR